MQYITYLINKLPEDQKRADKNISMDPLYTSCAISKWLLERDITMDGTLQINRVGSPPALKDVKEREELSSGTCWEKDRDTILSSYVVKTSKGKKNMSMLSTVNLVLDAKKDDGKMNTAIYKLYDFTKGGGDIEDQRMDA